MKAAGFYIMFWLGLSRILGVASYPTSWAWLDIIVYGAMVLVGIVGFLYYAMEKAARRANVERRKGKHTNLIINEKRFNVNG